MSFRQLLKASLIALIAVLLVACSSDSSSDSESSSSDDSSSETATGGEINIAYSAQPPVLDPQVGNAVITAEVMGHVFEPLLTTDSNYNIKPSLAESWEQSEDGLTITFEVKRRCTFP